MTLMNPNAYAHPSIMFAHWKGWDGKPVSEPPMFYTGLSELAADVLSSASDEVLKVSRIVSEKSGVDTSQVSKGKSTLNDSINSKAAHPPWHLSGIFHFSFTMVGHSPKKVRPGVGHCQKQLRTLKEA